MPNMSGHCFTYDHEICKFDSCQCDCHTDKGDSDVNVYLSNQFTDQEHRRLEFMRFLYRGGLVGLNDDYSPASGRITVPSTVQDVPEHSWCSDTDE